MNYIRDNGHKYLWLFPALATSFVAIMVFVSLMTADAAPDPPAPEPITLESRRGLGDQWIGGSDDLATTEVFEDEDTTFPYLFYWWTGIGVKCAAESCICLIQGWPADISIDTRCDITDIGTAPNDNDGFGACRKVGTSREFFRISREFFAKTDAVGRRDGVCETPVADGSRENGYPCNDDADCRTGNLDPGNDDVCDTDIEGGKTAWERTWGVFVYGAQNCDWTTEK